MSKQITVEQTLTSNTVSFDEDHSTYESVVSGYPIENGIGDGSGTYAGFVLTTGSSAYTYIYYNFDCSGIPEGATINSVSCRARASRSSTSSNYISSATLQVASGTSLKGSSTSVNTTTATYFDLTCGSWTRSELLNAKIRFTGRRGTRSTSSTSYYLRFFGAVLTVEYTYNGLAYTITAASNLEAITVEPNTQDIIAGNSGSVKINTDDISDIKVTDNNTDVTSLLVRKTVDTGGTVSSAPTSVTTSGSIRGTKYMDAVGHTAENPSSTTGSDYCSSSGSTATIYYHFSFDDLPSDATISNMSITAYGHRESSSDSREVADLNVYSGTTAKGTQTEFSSTSDHSVSITPGTWTRSELEDARLGFTIGYYGGLVKGATWSVTYTVPSSGDLYYYEYTITLIADDHVVVVEQAGAIEPPEEDPQYTYHPITISAINASTNPNVGTIRVVEGSNETITIHPSDPKLTLALDNGVDISSQLVGSDPVNEYSVATAPNASYGFQMNGDGYYESTNAGINKSSSVARVTFNLETDCLITFTYINYAEVSYDYGLFGKIDTTVATDGLTASSGSSSPSDSTSHYERICSASGYHSESPQTLTYNMTAGTHYIDVKYGKDDASADNNDSLQFKVSIEATGSGGDYTYTLSNISASHSLIFVFGDVEYYFVNSSGSNAKLFPDGSTVKLAGDPYSITIIPDNANANVSLRDNNVDKTSSLKRLDGVDKQGNPIVNYIYKLDSVTATHTLVITCVTSGKTVYIKVNGAWRAYSKVWANVNGTWVQQSDPAQVFDPNKNYVHQTV